MTELDHWLAAELAAPARVADEAFVAAALARIAAHEQAARVAALAEAKAYAATRRRLAVDALAQFAALAALIAGLVALSHTPALATFHLSPGLVAPPLMLVLGLWAWASGLFDPLRDLGEARA